jgi:uncharacterized membrane protein YfcA
MLDLPVALAGLFVGLVVGLTGMGGGALMTPLLVLLFGMEPLAAVSSDLVASMFMKPIGALVHHRRKTVHGRLVLWLVAGSVPAAFAGVLLLQRLGAGGLDVQRSIKSALGMALLVVVGTLVVRPLLLRQRVAASDAAPPRVKPLATLAVGVMGGFIVGLTSVGSGSLMMMLLLMLYPTIRLSALVGTDLMQAVPLVTSAAVAHMIFGDFQLHVTASILIGSIPGIYVGARLSSRATDQVIRPLLVLTLTASALKLLGASNVSVGIACAALGALSIAHRSSFGPPSSAASETSSAAE